MGEYIKKRSKTKSRISECLIDLLKTKSFYKITVKELCEKCNINRWTFYTYYENIDAVLLDIENNLFDDITLLNERFRDYNFNHTSNDKEKDLQTMEEMLRFNLEHREILLALFNNIEPRFVNKSTRNIQNTYKVSLNNSGASFGRHESYVIDFLIAGIRKITFNWLEKQDMSIEEMAKFIMKFIWENPYLEK